MSGDDDFQGDGDRSVADDRLLRFVERFAVLLSEMGLPRMAGRVFAYALADDADRYTASEFAQALKISPAAVSGAVRYLVQSGLLGKEREPGGRVDSYRVYDDDVWSAIAMQRMPMVRRWLEGIEYGLEQLEPGSAGWRRLRETRAYFEFVDAEMPMLMDRWKEYRRTLFEGEPSGAGIASTDRDAGRGGEGPAH